MKYSHHDSQQSADLRESYFSWLEASRTHPLSLAEEVGTSPKEGAEDTSCAVEGTEVNDTTEKP